VLFRSDGLPARHGWRVKVFLPEREVAAGRMPVSHDGLEVHLPNGEWLVPGLPDVTVEETGAAGFQAALADHSGKLDCVRLGLWEEADEWLGGSRVLPEYLVLHGALEAAAVDRVRAWGYDREVRLVAGEWPAGGPLPRVLEYGSAEKGQALGAGGTGCGALAGLWTLGHCPPEILGWPCTHDQEDPATI